MNEQRGAMPFIGPVIFAAFAFVFLILGCLDLCANPGVALQATLDSRAQWWILLVVFGFAMPAVFAATYAALPEAFGLPLYSRQLVYLHCGLHFCGLIAILLSPFVSDLPQAPMGPFLVACGAFVFVANVGLTLRKLPRPDAASAFLSVGCLWLIVASLLGVPFAAQAPLAALAGANWSAGWLFLAVAGVCFNVLYALGYRALCPSARTAIVWFGLAVVNTGIAWVAASLGVGPRSFVLLTAMVFFIGALIAHAAYLSLRDRVHMSGLSGARALSLALSFIPLFAALLLFAVSRHAGATPPSEPAFAENGAEQSAVFAVSALESSVALSALLAVIVPGLLGAIFSLRQKARLSRGFVVGYIVGAALAMCGAALAAKTSVAIGAGLLALAISGALTNLLRGVVAEFSAK